MAVIKETIDIDSDFSLESLGEIDLEIEKEKKRKKNREYVNNKELYQEFVKYNEAKKELEEQGKPAPQMPHKIAVACMQIARKYCTSYRFYSYSQDWKEEMIQDAILACAQNAMKFDIERTQNPFAFITTIVFNAVVARLNQESKEDYVKLKIYDSSAGYEAEEDIANNVDIDTDIENINEVHDMYRNRLDKIGQYEERFGLGKPRKEYERQNKKVEVTLDL